MRKIDAEAYNKRLHTEIMELDKLIKSINSENINQIDAGLIKTADRYTKLIADATWADNSNFNGIEMHKIKDLINYRKLHKSSYFVGRDMAKILQTTNPSTTGIYKVKSPSSYDSRNSFVFARMFIYNIHKVDVTYIDIAGLTAIENSAEISIRKTGTTISIDYNYVDNGTLDEDDEIWLDVLYVLWK